MLAGGTLGSEQADSSSSSSQTRNWSLTAPHTDYLLTTPINLHPPVWLLTQSAPAELSSSELLSISVLRNYSLIVGLGWAGAEWRVESGKYVQ